ncbi:MAG TPA: DUF3644 domain-containing protein [Gallicola sp.]|nr:DUF3644 domain-containing protein [Gallicola sp.]
MKNKNEIGEGKCRAEYIELIENSVSAYYAAIEIHNKPMISYRYETTTLLLLNSWELALKAFLIKFTDKSIFTKKNKTISFRNVLKSVGDFLCSKNFVAVKENLKKTWEYRNEIAHYYSRDIEAVVFMLTAKCALNYANFIKKHFAKEIFLEENLYILPLGFKLPFNPAEFLSPKTISSIDMLPAKNFIEEIVSTTHALDDKGVEDSIVLGFDICFKSIKNINNCDLIAAITTLDKADIAFAKEVKVKLTDDVGAAKVKLTEKNMIEMFPLEYKEVCNLCRQEIPGFKQNAKFNAIMRELKKNSEFCYSRKLNPRSKKSVTKTFYSESIIYELKKLYV